MLNGSAFDESCAQNYSAQVQHVNHTKELIFFENTEDLFTSSDNNNKSAVNTNLDDIDMDDVTIESNASHEFITENRNQSEPTSDAAGYSSQSI